MRDGDKQMHNEPVNVDEVRRLLDYDRDTGFFTWKKRVPDQFSETAGFTNAHKCALWNSKYAGRSAGTFNAYGYVVIKSLRASAHRLAWLHVHGEWPSKQIDHINGNRSDNCISNLRLADHRQNQANSPRRSTKSSKFKGVYKYGNRWKAFIGLNRKTRYLGIFKTEAEAAAAYSAAAYEAFGEFAYRADSRS